MKKKGNIEFLLETNTIRYNAIQKFKNNIIKIPSYVINEVFENNQELEIYHKNKLEVRCDNTTLFNRIKKIEAKIYDGKFRKQPITYRLNQIDVS